MFRRHQSGMTLLELMIVMGIIAFLSVLAFPNFIRARKETARNTCMSNLRQMEGAKQNWGLELKKASNASPADDDLFGDNLYMRIKPECPLGGDYDLGDLSTPVTCSKGPTDEHVLTEE